MTADQSNCDGQPKPREHFATTHWSVVLSAGGDQSSEAERALSTLCTNYWFPLYAFVRRSGHSAEDAEDLTQEFFARLLADNYLADADRERGRFRSFLLGAMKHFLANERRRRGAQKRGGRTATISLDFGAGEERYNRFEPVDTMTPERLYEKRWALALLDLVFSRLRDEFAAAGKLCVFERLKPYLAGKAGGPPYVEVAAELGMSEQAVKVAVHRMRGRYRKLLKQEIAQTVHDPEDQDDELRGLLAALGSE